MKFLKSQFSLLKAEVLTGTRLWLQKRFYLSPVKHAYIPPSLELLTLLYNDLSIFHILQHQLQNSTKILVFNNWSHNPLCTHCNRMLAPVPKRTLKVQNSTKQRLFTWLISLRD